MMIEIMKSQNHLFFITENYCDNCDSVVHVTFKVAAFWTFRVGRVRCPSCGFVIKPCNECFGTDIEDVLGCVKCPWNDSEISDAQSVYNGCYPIMPVPDKIFERID